MGLLKRQKSLLKNKNKKIFKRNNVSALVSLGLSLFVAQNVFADEAFRKKVEDLEKQMNEIIISGTAARFNWGGIVNTW